MAYSLDLRKKIVEFIRNGNSKVKAQKIFGVSKWCIYDWLKRDDLEPQRPPIGHNRKFDWQLLKEQVEQSPDMTIKQRSKALGVSPSCIGYALQMMNLTYKKNRQNTKKGVFSKE